MTIQPAVMRFALLGDHPDGLEMARALAEFGHIIAVYSGPAVGWEYLQRWGVSGRRVGDLEEVLADPDIEAVIVAGRPAQRPGQLRRALQSERHVVCVCPVDDSPDLAYEASMIQVDARRILFPLLPESLHPGVRRLAELARPPVPSDQLAVAPPLAARLLEMERWSSEEILLEADELGHRPGLPGWDILRQIGGEVGEIYAQAGPDDIERGQPLLLTGQFLKGGLFQATCLPLQADAKLRVALIRRNGRAELVFPQGWPGPAQLTYTSDEGQERSEQWDAFDPWAALALAFNETLAGKRPPGLDWQDAIRGLELDDAARRSVQRRRASVLEHQQVTEEETFKGTMTLVGCSILWISLMLLIASAWLPWLGWIIAPVFGIFLVLQLLRWALPQKPVEPKS